MGPSAATKLFVFEQLSGSSEREMMNRIPKS